MGRRRSTIVQGEPEYYTEDQLRAIRVSIATEVFEETMREMFQEDDAPSTADILGELKRLLKELTR